jgi:predicted Rossmann fold nucleotide-binding protein DprA/Smf involved in DNA uptake
VIGVGASGPRGDEIRQLPLARPAAEAAYRAEAGWSRLRLGDLDVEAERPYWIAISLIPGIGPVGFARLLHRFGSARGAWEAGPAMLDGLPRLQDGAVGGLVRLRRSGALALARRVQATLRGVGGSVVTALDEGYPSALATVDPRPPVLYVKGDRAAFEAPAVAVVGTPTRHRLRTFDGDRDRG